MIWSRKKNDHGISSSSKRRGGLWQILLKSRSFVVAFSFLMLLVFVGLFGDFLANDKPIYCKYEGKTYFPVLREQMVDFGLAKWKSPFIRADWANLEYESYLFPPIRYKATTNDPINIYKSPFEEQEVNTGYWHWLGTADQLGKDVASGMISGTRLALLVALIAMSIAAFLGILLGGLAGYYGDYSLKTSWLRQIGLVFGLLLGCFWGFSSRQAIFWDAVDSGALLGQLVLGMLILSLTTFIFYQLGKILERMLQITPNRFIKVDFWVMRSIEVLNSIPGLFLLLAALAIVKVPSIVNVMVVIGLISWTGIARFVRAEFLRIRSLDYIQAGKIMGFSDARILLRHALPNAIGPVLVTIAFGMAGAILLESALSFLGIGSGQDDVSWGGLLQLARGRPTAWWVALFPGLAIFLTVMAFNTIGEALTNAMNTSSD